LVSRLVEAGPRLCNISEAQSDPASMIPTYGLLAISMIIVPSLIVWLGREGGLLFGVD
jgi:hypothetical protein